MKEYRCSVCHGKGHNKLSHLTRSPAGWQERQSLGIKSIGDLAADLEHHGVPRSQLGTLDDTMETYEKLSSYVRTLTEPPPVVPATAATHPPAPAPLPADLAPPARLHPTKEHIVSQTPEYVVEESGERILHKVVTAYDDGTVVVATSGAKAIRRPNGIKEVHKANGEYRVQSPDGTVESGKTDGTVIVTYPDGLRDITLPLPDGRVQRQYRDGRVINEYPQGMTVKQEENGRVIVTMLARAPRTTVGQDGIKRTEHAIGYSETRYPDGSAVTVWSDGRVDRKDTNGRTAVTGPDGSTFRY